jgi:glucose/arabinose dehydrogenase
MKKILPAFRPATILSRLSLQIFTTVIAFCSCFISNASAQTLPAGFSRVLVANGISNPTVMAFAPDGRIFVAQQGGQLRVIKNGVLLATPFVSLSVNSSGERGLLGIAFDPDFANNNFIYLYYTLSTATNNRVSRFTANGDVAIAGSEQVILNLDPLSGATNHNGGTMQFGPDGKLYIGVGENANSAWAQNLDSYHGKILRINPDGSVPAGNPFTTGSAQRQRVWAYGLRNPYTLTFQPGTGRLFVNDVGEVTWEEINDATTGGLNFGWPGAEGNSSNPAYTNPVYAYLHGSGPGVGCAITGGTFFNPSSTNYPATYTGKYFYIDYCGNWIDQLTLSGSTGTRSGFGSSVGAFPVSIVTGTDGNLYFLSRSNSAVYRIIYTSNTAPVITNHPQSISVSQGNPATFAVTATGTAPLSYQWRKTGSDIGGANNATYTIPDVTPADAGDYSVVVTNVAGSATSNDATLTVTTPNQNPDGTIITPTIGANYGGGDVINFSGSATDPESGTLGASAFTWYVTFYHDAHTHPGPSAPSGVTSGSFTIPNSGETSANVFYRLFLVVTDPQGVTDTSFTDIVPRTSSITINTNPQGLGITLDGQPFTAPLTVSSVEGILRTIGTPSPQSLAGTSYAFSNWSQGGTQTQTLATPVNDAIYTANFVSTSVTLNPVADAYVQSGNRAGANFGNATVLNTQNTTVSKGLQLTYLRFNISSLGTNSSAVKLRLYGRFTKNGNSSAAVQVFNVLSQTWQENTITYNNKPAEQTTVLASTTVAGSAFQFYEWDLTQHINALRSSGATTVSLLVKNLTVTTNNSISFNSKENALNKPELQVVASPSPAPPSFTSTNHKFTQQSLLSMYPNPASDNVMIKYPPGQNGQLMLSDIQGRLLKRIMPGASGWQQIPVGDLKEGTYLLWMDRGGITTAQKLLIMR